MTRLRGVRAAIFFGIFEFINPAFVKTLFDLEVDDPAKAETIDRLLMLYETSKYYPSEPSMLQDWEVTKEETTSPSGGGGFGDCWQGTLLGRIAVAMKCSRFGTEADVAMRVGYQFHTIVSI